MESEIKTADAALDGDSNDAEHDALYEIRNALAGYLGEPEFEYPEGGGRRLAVY